MNAKQFLTTALATTGLIALMAEPALSDPPPWAGKKRWENGKSHRHDQYYGHVERRHQGQRWHDHRRSRYDDPNHRYYGHTGLDHRDLRLGANGHLEGLAYDGPFCQRVVNKIQRSSEGLVRGGATNRHRDAQRDWRRNLANAQHDLRECRAHDQRRALHNRHYDPSSYYPYYDPYPRSLVSAGADFELKRDWLILIGLLRGTFGGR